MTNSDDMGREAGVTVVDDRERMLAEAEAVVAPKRRSLLKRVLSGAIFGVIVPVAIVLGGVIVAKKLLDSGPEAKRKPPVKRARLVTVEDVHFESPETVVRALGTVLASRTAEIQPRVSGEIVWLSDQLIPGGLIDAGDELIVIDPADYAITVRQREADVARAQSDLDVEFGRQAVAKRELELLGDTVDVANRELMLRKPQLDAAKATLASAEAALERARLDFARATVKAPFDALVRVRYVDLGTQVNPSTKIAALQGTEEYWVEVAVPVDELRWIRIPRREGEVGSTVRIYDEAAWGDGIHRVGTVLRLGGDIEQQGRMARLLVSVPDPLARKKENAGQPSLILGSYLRVEIVGSGLESAVAVDRRFLRNGDRVWVMSEAKTLEVREVKVAFRGAGTVYVTEGIEAGEKLIVSDLSSPVPGMALRTAEDVEEGEVVTPGGAARAGGGHGN